MKRLISMLLVIGLALWVVSMVEAATSVPVTATASVTQELNLTVSISKVDSKGTDTYTDDTWDPTPVTSMAFGSLTHTLASGADAGTLYSTPYYYVALLGGSSSGRKYRMWSNCSGLVSGTVTIVNGFGVTYLDDNPKKADGVTPINPSAKPADASLGTTGLAAGGTQPKLLYDSGSTGAARVIGAYFGIPPYKSDGSVPYAGFVPLSTDTPGGNYTGTVTFSITLY